ncbi:DNA primase [Fusobacterium hwasookii]|uniref:DNA primase n=1 Tax=Fusobacterium hwasookii ChDC F128 TaxID=1216362 RepID=A0ABN0GZN1_9FUSO|nr:DNA primase [Fusobacterium hwasookii]EJU07385.1 DNA primase [Fusobacterium hwasookii ChDC F128]QNE65829.1 DNA primase [Fusobacterium hwasookii]
MYFKQEDIDKLLDNLRIEEVVGEFIELKKVGSSYKGLCPFHADTNPSFSVTPEKKICKCFVCGSGGNSINFYSKIKNISYTEAIRELAKKYRINIKEYNNTNPNENYEKFYNIMEETHNFFMDKMFSQDSRGALEYLSNRGLDTDLIKEHQLGYASPKWSELYELLNSKGYSDEDLLALGLVKKSEEGRIYDAFRNRVIFPIFSPSGRIIAFGGRSLEKDDSIPKYINSPDTPIFKKGKNIYGIERAINIKNKNYSILMEGYMDVLSANIFGFDTSIAPLGTALTEEQAQLIKRYSSNILLSFDMDKAGISATERASFILKAQGFNIRVLQFEESKDPDEFLKKNGREAFLKVVENSLEIFDFLYNLYSSEYDLNNIIAKQNFIERFKEFFINIENDLEKEMYLKKLSEKTDISIDVLRKTLVEQNKKHFIRKDYIDEAQEKIEKKEFKQANNLEMAIIKMLLRKPNYYENFFINENLESDIAKKIFKFFNEKIKENLFSDSNTIMKEFKNYVEESKDFSEYDKSNELARIIMDYALSPDKIEEERENIELFKSYLREKLKLRDKTKDDIVKKFEFGKLKKEIEKTKSVEEFIEVYNSFKYLF